jgi:hypothetical protein
MTDDEYMDLNAIMECAGIDIDDGREMAIYFLRLAGAKVKDNAKGET